MMNRNCFKKPIGLIIGRFQPFHKAHHKIIQYALNKFDKVVVLIGSYRHARDIHNPFVFSERENMILSALSNDEKKKVVVRAVRDYTYNDSLWVSEVQRIVDEITEEEIDVCLVGHHRDDSSFYLDLFPQWGFDEVGQLENDISASTIRKEYLTNPNWKDIVGSKLPESIITYLDNFKTQKQYQNLVEEYKFVQDYKALWSSSPYPPIFVTVDSIVLKSGHVLLVRRKSAPGKNLFAFPGGYLQQNESLVDGAIRELKEETGIKVARDVLRNSIKSSHVFDKPNRDLRGRVITHGYLIDLGSGPLPKVKGGDDAADAWWVPLHEAFSNDDSFYADHWHILNYFTFGGK